MSDDHGRDYSAGLSGQGAENVTNADAYAAGQGARQAGDASQEIIDGKPKRSGLFRAPTQSYGLNAQGCGFLMFLPFLPVIYPAGGALVVGAFFLGGAVGALFNAGAETRAILSILAVLPAIPFSFKLERFANRLTIYRWLRHPIRGVLLGAFIVLMILTGGVVVSSYELAYEWRNASPRQMFYCFAAFPMAILLSLFADHYMFQGIGRSPERLAAEAERQAKIDSGEQPAEELVLISMPRFFGYFGAAVVAAYATPLNIGETAIIAFAALCGWYQLRRRRQRATRSEQSD